jgi:hypothetical protein
LHRSGLTAVNDDLRCYSVKQGLRIADHHGLHGIQASEAFQPKAIRLINEGGVGGYDLIPEQEFAEGLQRLRADAAAGRAGEYVREAVTVTGDAE